MKMSVLPLISPKSASRQAFLLIARTLAVDERAELASLDAFLEQLSQVGAEDVARVAREYLNENRRFVVTLAQGEGS